MCSLESKKDFINALKEFDYVIEQAIINQGDDLKYNTLLKCAILLLTAKLEKFFEDMIEEYCYFIREIGLNSNAIPFDIKLSATKKLFNEEFISSLNNSKKDKITSTLERISSIWCSCGKECEIDIDTSLAFGKHGEAEIKKLFQRIGVENVFDLCKITIIKEDIIGTGEEIISITSDLNALIGYRNYVSHQDGLPSVTHGQLNDYRNNLILFVNEVEKLLVARLLDMQNSKISVVI